MDPMTRRSDERFNLPPIMQNRGRWTKSPEEAEAKYEYDGNKKAKKMNYANAVDRLLKDPWYVQNLSQRKTTSIGSATCAKWLAEALAIKNSAG